MRACVVETGKPAKVARITVSPAPRATASRKAGEAATGSGTKPLPEKRGTSESASASEAADPAKVVATAQRSAPL